MQNLFNIRGRPIPPFGGAAMEGPSRRRPHPEDDVARENSPARKNRRMGGNASDPIVIVDDTPEPEERYDLDGENFVVWVFK